MKISGNVYKSSSYNGFNYPKNFIRLNIFEFFSILAIEEIDKRRKNVKDTKEGNFSQSTLIKPIICKNPADLIRICSHFQNRPQKQRPGFYLILPYDADIMLNENNIRRENG